MLVLIATRASLPQNQHPNKTNTPTKPIHLTTNIPTRSSLTLGHSSQKAIANEDVTPSCLAPPPPPVLLNTSLSPLPRKQTARKTQRPDYNFRPHHEYNPRHRRQWLRQFDGRSISSRRPHRHFVCRTSLPRERRLPGWWIASSGRK